MTVGKLVGRYEIITQLGRGGFAVTFLAADKHMPGNPYCVVKHLQPLSRNPDTLKLARSLFEREAQILFSLGLHDQIPRALAYFEENEQFYIVQEYIEGQDLTHEIIPGKQLSENYVVNLLQDILEIIRFVHQNNFIHLDIKPENLVRRKHDGKIVIIDFLVGKSFFTSRFDAQKQDAIIIGTPGYMPPEQVFGHPEFCTDIYAVGIIGIQALTGIRPRQFERDINTNEIVWRNQCQVSKKLATILSKMVKDDYRSRYQSVDEILKALDNLGNSTTYSPKEDNLSGNPVQLIGRWVQRFFGQKQENSTPAKEIAETATLPPVRQPTLSPETILQTPEKVYEIVQTYIQEEHFDQALATAQQIPDEQKQLEALTKVIQAVSKLESNPVLELLAPLQNHPNERVRQLVREFQFTSFPQPQVISRDEALARIEFVKGDLLDLDVDALVNPTGLDVSYGGAISVQLFQRLGSKLYEALWNQPLLRSGEVFVTDAGSLPAHYLIHTPTEENEGWHTTASIVRGVASRSHSLLKTTLEEAASSLPGDFRSRLVSLGQYLFQSLLPEELQNTFRTIASLNHPFTLLILADQDAWFPWELLHDGQKFLGDRLIIGRWLWELEKARPYEFPVGAVNVAHYASVEQPELWTELLHSSGAPPRLGFSTHKKISQIMSWSKPNLLICYFACIIGCFMLIKRKDQKLKGW